MQFDNGLIEEILEDKWKNKIDTKYGKNVKQIDIQIEFLGKLSHWLKLKI